MLPHPLLLSLVFIPAVASYQKYPIKNTEPKCLVQIDEVGFNYVAFWGDFGRDSVKEITATRITRHKSSGKIQLSRKDRYSWGKEDLIPDEYYALNKFKAPLLASDGFRKGRWYAVCARPTRSSGCQGECAIIRFCDCNCNHRLFLRMGLIYSHFGTKLASPVVSLAVSFLPSNRPSHYLWDISVESRLSWLDCTEMIRTSRSSQCSRKRKEFDFAAEKKKVIHQAKTWVFSPPAGTETFEFRTNFRMNVSDMAELLKPYGTLDEDRYSFQLPVILLQRYHFRNASVSIRIPYDNTQNIRKIREECHEVLKKEDKQVAALELGGVHGINLEEYDLTPDDLLHHVQLQVTETPPPTSSTTGRTTTTISTKKPIPIIKPRRKVVSPEEKKNKDSAEGISRSSGAESSKRLDSLGIRYDKEREHKGKTSDEVVEKNSQSRDKPAGSKSAGPETKKRLDSLYYKEKEVDGKTNHEADQLMATKSSSSHSQSKICGLFHTTSVLIYLCMIPFLAW